MNRLTQLKDNKTEKGHDHVDKVEAYVLKNNKLFNKDNIKSYIYYWKSTEKCTWFVSYITEVIKVVKDLWKIFVLLQ